MGLFSVESSLQSEHSMIMELVSLVFFTLYMHSLLSISFFLCVIEANSCLIFTGIFSLSGSWNDFKACFNLLFALVPVPVSKKCNL